MDLLSIDQVSTKLGVSRQTLAWWRCCGTGPKFCKISTKSIKYTVQDVNDFVLSTIRSSTAEGES